MEKEKCLDLVEKPEAWCAQLCSCTKCDSFNCFALRYHSAAGCRCKKCDHSKTCLFYQNLKRNLSSNFTCKPKIVEEKIEKEKLHNTCINENSANYYSKQDQKRGKEKKHNTCLNNCATLCNNQDQKRGKDKLDNTCLNENSSTHCNKQEEERGKQSPHNTCLNANNSNPCNKQEKKKENEKLHNTNISENETITSNKQEDSEIKTSESKENSGILNIVKKIFSNLKNENEKPAGSESLIGSEKPIVPGNESTKPNISNKTQRKLIIDKNAHDKSGISANDKENANCDVDMEKDDSEYKIQSLLGLDEVSKKHKLEKIKALKTEKKCKCEACRPSETKKQTSENGSISRIVITKNCEYKHIINKPCNRLKESIQKEIVYEYDKEKNITKKISREHKIFHQPTVACCMPRNTSAKLSAQVMNVPYKDYEKTLNQLVAPNESKTKKCIDIFQKILDIYNACTCKVCECIATVVPNLLKQNCNCKPCNCEDCRKQSSIDQQLMRDFKRKQRKTSSALSNNYDCDPSNCRNYQAMISNPCDCNLCECIECVCLRIKKRGNFIVAPVGEGTQRVYCQCSPCGCFECAHPYGTITRTPVTHEMSTEVHRNLNCNCETCNNDHCEQEGADTCNCDRHSKVMRKPVQKDSNDYDIRHCTIRSHNTDKCLCRKDKKRNAVAMFATIPNANLAKKGFKNPDFCKYSFKKLSPNAVELSQNLTSLKINSITKNSIDTCDCKPCDCIKCRQHYLEGHIASEKGCVCEICDCINCATMHTISEGDSRDICNCKPCECVECQSYNITSANRKSYVNKTRYENILLDSESPSPSVISDRNNSEQVISSLNTSDSEHFLDLILTDKESKNRDLKNVSRKIISKNNPKDYQLYCDVTEGSKYFNSSKDVRYSQMICKPKSGQVLNNNNSKVNNDFNIFKLSDTRKDFDNDKHVVRSNKGPVLQSSTNDASTESSGASTSGITHTDGWSGETSTKRHETSKSRDSSCNSSGHDYSDYLIRFPRSTVETCINDVMNLNMYKQSNLRGYIRPSIMRSKPSKETNSSNVSENNMNRLSLKGNHLLDNRETLKIDTGRISYMKMCKNWNSKTPCDCQPCDCDKCVYKIAKFNQCQCDCAACSCIGTCLNEDQTVFIRKNEITQTNEPLQGNGEDSWDGEYYASSDMKSLGTKFMPSWSSPCNLEVTKDKESSFLKKSNVTFSDAVYNKVVKSSPFQNVNRAINSCLNTSLQIQPQDLYTNYGSVKKTLTDARAFSMDLLAVLQKYEKANQEFDSVSKKYEIFKSESLNSTTKGSEYNCSKVLEKQDKTISDFDTAHDKLNISEFSETNLCSNLILADEPRVQAEKESENSNKYKKVRSQNSLSNYVIEQNESEACECEQLEDKRGTFQIVDPTSDKGEGSKDIRVHDSVSQTDKIQTGIILENPVEDINRIENKNIKRFHDKMILSDLKDQYKLYSKLINRAIIRCKRDKWKTSESQELNSLTTTDDTSAECKFPKLNKTSTTKTINKEEYPDLNVQEQDSRQLNTVFISAVDQKDNISFNRNEDEIIYSTNRKCLPVNEEINESNDEKKYVTQKLGQKHTTQISELPEDEGKRYESNDVMESNEFSSTDYGQASTSQDEHIKTNLSRNFESVPSMTLKRLGLHLSDIKTVANPNHGIKSSCDLMKISFQTVRKVSDHTIIVKWKIPPVTTGVLGYELLVDGRAVQKVLSPTRNMAVITCLPHSDKVFLTVRTITSKTTCGRYPSTTFVYRPRVK